MDKPKAWGKSRSVSLFIVVALHCAVLTLLVMASRNQHYGESAERAIELVYLPAFKAPRVRADTISRPHVRTDIATARADIPVPPAPPTGTSAAAPGSASTSGGGSGVNWLAEAHRAVKAYEIRRDQPSDAAQSVSSRDEWWPRQHRAGDQYKTENGDWIVWISAECYQVAVAHPNPAALSSATPQTICPKQGAPHGE